MWCFWEWITQRVPVRGQRHPHDLKAYWQPYTEILEVTVFSKITYGKMLFWLSEWGEEYPPRMSESSWFIAFHSRV